MLNEARILEEVPGLYRVVLLNLFRKTPGVLFDNVPTNAFAHIDAIDRVMHEPNAVSPGPVGDIRTTWYMHPHQEDNLIVLHGVRHVELYTKKHGRIERFAVSAAAITHQDRAVSNAPAMLCWPTGVFHRVISGPDGSAAINFARHHPGIDIRANFNIYELDTETGRFSVAREGHSDQPL